MSKSKQPQEKSAGLTITSLDQLTKLIETPCFAEFRLDGREVRVPVHRMSAITAESVRALRREALPPFKKERNDYDHYAPEYLTKAALNEKMARSLIVYAHCPLVSGGKPGLSDRAAIHAYVEGLFTDNILELLSLTIQAGGMERVDERTNFTSPADSES